MKLSQRLWLAVVLLAAPAVFNSAAAETPAVIDRIVAVVDDNVILQSELDQGIQFAQGQMRERGITPPPDNALAGQVLERLILVRVQTDRAAAAGIKIDDRELNEVISNIARQNKMSVAEFADSVKRDGMDFGALREEVRNEILINRVREKEVDSRIVVTDQDINQFLAAQGGDDDNEYQLSHILVAVPDGASPEVHEKARAKAEALLKRLRAGEDFAQIAAANSDGQQALQGGDLGWRKGSSLPTAFANVAPKLKVGDISDVIAASNGFNIIKLVNERTAGERQTVVETHARHILLTPNAIRNEDATRAQAFELYDRLQKGEDMAPLARKYSDDPGSKNSGGDLGWQPSAIYAPEFQSRIDALQPGQMSQPFHSQFGWHIAQVLDRRTRDITEEARRGKARQTIMQRKEGEEYDSWVRRLREEAYVEYRLGNDQAAPALPAKAQDGAKGTSPG